MESQFVRLVLRRRCVEGFVESWIFCWFSKSPTQLGCFLFNWRQRSKGASAHAMFSKLINKKDETDVPYPKTNERQKERTAKRAQSKRAIIINIIIISIIINIVIIIIINNVIVIIIIINPQSACPHILTEIYKTEWLWFIKFGLYISDIKHSYHASIMVPKSVILAFSFS